MRCSSSPTPALNTPVSSDFAKSCSTINVSSPIQAEATGAVVFPVDPKKIEKVHKHIEYSLGAGTRGQIYIHNAPKRISTMLFWAIYEINLEFHNFVLELVTL